MRNARSWKGWIPGFALVAAVTAMQAQSGSATAAGTVTGHVTCADTHLPARFAEVVLVLKQDTPGKAADGSNDPGAKPQTQQKTILANARTLLDGSFVFHDVPPGDYYVVAKLTGYIPPVSYVESDDDAEEMAKVLAGAPVVHVAVERTSVVNLTLRRGGTIAGRVQFEDGSPLAGGPVKVEAVEGIDPAGYLDYALAHLDYGRAMGMTDDQGRYRVAGLPPGRYRVRLQMEVVSGLRISSWGEGEQRQYGQSTSSGVTHMLSIYEPGTLRKSKATVVEIKGDESHDDANMSVALTGLHSVSGSVAPRHDRCAVGYGVVGLLDPSDGTVVRSGDLELDGSFTINYVPDGTYTLWVQAAMCESTAGPEGSAKKDGMRQFMKASVPVIVETGDVTVEPILLDDFYAAPDH